jgi:hypothetical protein
MMKEQSSNQEIASLLDRIAALQVAQRCLSSPGACPLQWSQPRLGPGPLSGRNGYKR